MTTATVFNSGQPLVSRRTNLRGIAANTTFVLKAGRSLRRIIGASRGTTAVTGGIRIGTATGGSQVLAAQPVPAVGTAGEVFDVNLLAIPVLLTDQVLYVEAVTAWNGGIVDLSVESIETNTVY